MRKPFFRKDRNCWYVKDSDGSFIRLDPSKKKAHDIWQQMMANADLSGRVAFAALCEAFFKEHKNTISAGHFDKMWAIAEMFCERFGRKLADDVSSGLVIGWLKEDKPGPLRKDGTRNMRQWSLSRQRDAGATLKRILAWGLALGHVRRNQLATMQLQSSPPRTQIIQTDVHRLLVVSVLKSKSRSFATYLIASHCGARPQQIREIELANISHDFSYSVFAKHKTAYVTGEPLVVYHSPCMQTLLRILAAKRPKGNLFLNDQGKAWRKDTVGQRMTRLREKLKLEAGVVAYAYRHTFATDSILAGNDLATVAALMGHTNTEMVSRVYNHINQNRQHMLEAARKTYASRHASRDERQ